MKILVIGATGMVGSRVVAEAAQRGHQVVAASRGGREVTGAASTLALDLDDTGAVVGAINDADASVITVPGNRGGDQQAVIGAHEALIAARPARPFLVVGGAGSLEVDGGLLKDSPDFPAEYKDEAEVFTTVLERYRDADAALPWTLVSPAPVLAPGERTGHVTLGLDSPAGEHISVEDLAMVIVDELEHPAHAGRRFTAAD